MNRETRRRVEKLERRLRGGGKIPVREAGRAGQDLLRGAASGGGFSGGRGISPITAALGSNRRTHRGGIPGGGYQKLGMPSISSGLSGVLGGDEEDRWQVNAPRLPEAQQELLFGILRRVHAQYSGREVTRESFVKIHDRMQLEIAERISDAKPLKGLVISLEWRGYFSEAGLHYFNEVRRDIEEPPHTLPYLDCHITPDNRSVMDGDLFDMMGVFRPCVVAHQYGRREDYLESAEEAIAGAVKRAKDGDGYYSERDRQMGQGVSGAPLSAPREMQGDPNGGGEG